MKSREMPEQPSQNGQRVCLQCNFGYKLAYDQRFVEFYYKLSEVANKSWTYLISEFLVMMIQTRELPMMSTTMRRVNIVVTAM